MTLDWRYVKGRDRKDSYPSNESQDQRRCPKLVDSKPYVDAQHNEKRRDYT